MAALERASLKWKTCFEATFTYSPEANVAPTAQFLHFQKCFVCERSSIFMLGHVLNAALQFFCCWGQNETKNGRNIPWWDYNQKWQSDLTRKEEKSFFQFFKFCRDVGSPVDNEVNFLPGLIWNYTIFLEIMIYLHGSSSGGSGSRRW